MDKPTVFISYSHKDEAWKDALRPHLHVLEQTDQIKIWDDRKIDAGAEWYPEIKATMERAAVSICLISADYLASDFCQKEEIPFLLNRRKDDGMLLLPLLVRPCLWKVVPWLRQLQMLPRDGKAISKDFKDDPDEIFTAVAESVYEFIEQLKPVAAEVTLESITTLNISGDRNIIINGNVYHSALVSGDANALLSAPPPPKWNATPPEAIEITRLPTTGMDVFGRDAELNLLDEVWEKQEVKVLSFVAWGGVGKSTLINKWLAGLRADNYRGAERVYAWSFYSQGTSDRAASADLFMDQALRWFGDADPTAGTPWDKGERLAALIRQRRTLLLLDGLEPLQSGHAHERGKLKDPALLTLLEELARENPGLCVISTRERITDLDEMDLAAFAPDADVFVVPPSGGSLNAADFRLKAGLQTPAPVLQLDLETLAPPAARAFLRVGGVRGTDEELEATAAAFGNHALALKLLAEYLRGIPGHHISDAAQIPDLDIPERDGKHPRRVIAALAARFGAGPEMEVLRLLGLFDRTADKASLDALRKAPKIAGLTEHIGAEHEANWLRAVQRLRQSKLLDEESRHAPDELDAHPLVREHFRAVLQQDWPDAWRAANDRLYEHLTRTAKELPDTLAEMEPLFAALAHGCAAGRTQEALNEVFWWRLRRGNQAFAIRKLGAYGAELGALRNFFATPWRQPAAELKPADQAFILNEAGFDLRALGQLTAAVHPMQAGLEMRLAQKAWKNASTIASNLSELTLTLGELPSALAYAQQCIELADRSGDSVWRMASRPKLADALHQAGRLTEAAAAFREAETLQKEWQPDSPLLYSMRGFQYCDLLLTQGHGQAVRTRAAQTIEIAKRTNWLLDIALNQLALGRARLWKAQQSVAPAATPTFAEAGQWLQRAVDGLRQAGTVHHLPRGLLARAAWFRLAGVGGDALACARAWRDLHEVFRLAQRGAMKLHLTDAHLEAARLYLAQGDPAAAHPHWEQAHDLVAQTGYHRRDPEVEELRQALR